MKIKDNLPEPDGILQEIIEDLESALEESRGILVWS